MMKETYRRFLMSTEKHHPSGFARYYQIIVEGKLNPGWSDWLGSMRVVSRKEADGMQITTLSGGLGDQVALRGIMNHLWDLNLTVRSVQQVDPDTDKTND
jgi:hypothetical protein